MSLEQRTIRDAKGNVIGVLGPEAFFSGALGNATAAGIPVAQQRAFSLQVSLAPNQAAINQLAAAQPLPLEVFKPNFLVPQVLKPTTAPVGTCPS